MTAERPRMRPRPGLGPADRIGGVILAGGLGRRMGGADKALLELGGTPLVQRAIDRLAPQLGPVAINANGDPARFAPYRREVLPDPVAGHPGPLAGVLAGLIWAEARGLEAIVTVAADTPFFPRDLVVGLRLAAASEGTPIALAASADPEGRLRRHPTFGLWSVALRPALAEALEAGVRKVVAFTDAQGAATAVFKGEAVDPFFNVNTPEDLARAEELLEALV